MLEGIIDTTRNDQITDILAWWFGDPDPAVDITPNMARWFGGGAEVDSEIRARFGGLVHKARDGALDEWRATTAGTLALIVLLDQFSRNLFRDDGAAWASDRESQRVALAALALGIDQQVGFSQRGFFYLPLEHAEDPVLQRVSLQCFERLNENAPAHHKDLAGGWLQYAVKHKAVVDRFGRFPHRNAPMGRQSTDDEARFLAEEGRGF